MMFSSFFRVMTLNRMDSEHFPDTVHGVIYQKNQYSSMTGERVTRCWVKEELCELVRSELKERTDYDVVFFRTGLICRFLGESST